MSTLEDPVSGDGEDWCQAPGVATSSAHVKLGAWHQAGDPSAESPDTDGSSVLELVDVVKTYRGSPPVHALAGVSLHVADR